MLAMTRADNNTSTLLLQYMCCMISQGNTDRIFSKGNKDLGK